ncbi:MAG: bifunctional cobalt-precorrin-7 (C(5))-methyltransferase/cobalt-precorrin-6B (C(15))-methyltransferase, partial [Paludibacteraceae bacterium]|nr:bifunctional cobalt-precorrin-7 (C(5))-methyltransferase/cobalt-precorrin-6B (C(15))-methyltransferase [Paludibacteraceae bacterium]
MIMRLKSVMSPTCDIVFNSVSEDSKLLFEEGISEAGMRITSCTRMTIDDHNPIYILKAQ